MLLYLLQDDLDDALDTKTGIGSHPSPPSRASVTGKIKAEWYRRVLGEALLRQELDRLERWKGFDVAKKVADTWEKDFIRNAKNVRNIRSGKGQLKGV